jgi:hypothetical protein
LAAELEYLAVEALWLAAGRPGVKIVEGLAVTLASRRPFRTSQDPQGRGHSAAQQRAFNAFRHLYNEERPHEALQDRPPATLYCPSPRAYTGTLPPVEYPGHFIVKRVTNAGAIRLKKRLLFIANALKQHPVGLEEVDDGIWSIHFCHVLLGPVDEQDYIIHA